MTWAGRPPGLIQRGSVRQSRPGRCLDHRPAVRHGDRLRRLEGKAALAQPPQDPMLGADLRDGQEPADPQDVTLLPGPDRRRGLAVTVTSLRCAFRQ